MWIGLLWIIGCYGTSIALLHIGFGLRSRKSKQTARVLLITRNNAIQIEWYIRSLFFFSRMKGRELIVTILDDGSADDTIRIIERLSRSYKLNVELCSPENSLDEWLRAYEEEPIVVVRLGNREELVNIPAF